MFVLGSSSSVGERHWQVSENLMVFSLSMAWGVCHPCCSATAMTCCKAGVLFNPVPVLRLGGEGFLFSFSAFLGLVCVG